MAIDIVPQDFDPHLFHQKAEELREQDHHAEALSAIDQAIVGYQQNGNYAKMSETLQSRFLIYKHLFLLTKDDAYRVLARNDTKASIHIALYYGEDEMLPSCYFRLGEANMLFEEFEEAAKHFLKAVELFEEEKAEKGDYMYHYGEALFRSGQRQNGRKIMLLGLELIQKNPDKKDSFFIHVWESGAHIKLAELLHDDYPEEAQSHLEQAKSIIQKDERLIIRKRQLKELEKILK